QPHEAHLCQAPRTGSRQDRDRRNEAATAGTVVGAFVKGGEMKTNVIPMMTWEKVREAYGRMVQMGWQSVQQAMTVGEMLMEMRDRRYHDDPQGIFFQCAGKEAGIEKSQAYNLMKLAAHRQLLERSRPESQAKALALIPKKERKQAARKAERKVV